MTGLDLQALSAMRKNLKKIPVKRINLTVPAVTRQKWDEMLERDAEHGDGKPIGTAAITLIVSLPAPLREALFDWGKEAERRPDICGNLERFLAGFADRLFELMKNRAESSTPEPDAWEEAILRSFVDRLLDPRILRQGKGGSDRSTRLGA